MSNGALEDTADLIVVIPLHNVVVMTVSPDLLESSAISQASL